METLAQDRRLARLSVAIVLGRWDELRRLRGDAPPNEPDRAWREALLQAHLFAGFPRVVEALGILEEAGGLGELEPGEALYEPDHFARGRTLFERIYAEQAAPVRERLEGFHPVFARWIEGHAYGRVLARAGLAPARREILAVACLAALDQDRQLASHARGALLLGASELALTASLDAVADLIDDQALRRARGVLDRFAAP